VSRRLRKRARVLVTVVPAAVAAVALAWVGLVARGAQTPPQHVVTVSSVQALSAAVARAQPGDRIELADGVYGSGTVTVRRSGTAAAPITIAAANLGRAQFTGSAAFDLRGASHVVVTGFLFNGGKGFSVPVGAVADRITRNVFQGNLSGADLTVGADDTEVDHNTFQNRTAAGVYLQVVGPGAHDMAKRVHVHHNYFFNHQFKGSNGGESIRFGLSSRQHGQAYGLIEYNLFEKADGDSEAISVKSSNNVVRYNTIINSRGTISLRHGWNNTVDGNVLVGGTTGIRFFGNNHTIINNLVQDTTGQPLEVGGGEIRDDTANTTAHEAADHVLVAFNTISGTSGRLVAIGSGKKFAPSDITLADNILLGHRGSAVGGTGAALQFQGNILFGATAGSMPAGGYRIVDPHLVRDANGLLWPMATSPAIGTAAGSYPQVTMDLDRQPRLGVKDVGAVEYAAGAPQARPLTIADVGPTAP
jgi:chondroitinase B-like protein